MEDVTKQSDKLQLRLPEHFEEFEGDQLMSNFDHEINQETADHIKGKELFSRYAGWNFNGKVWWDAASSKWCCEIWRYHSLVEVLVHDDLEGIMEDACDRWGNQ